MPKTLAVKDLAISEQELILLAMVLKKPKEYLLSHPETKLNQKQAAKFKKMQNELRKGTPLAYVLGKRWFLNEQFLVNKNILIPRPETEKLVELAFDYCQNEKPDIICDIGTGTGAIIISLSQLLNQMPKYTPSLYASDISENVLKIAKKNAGRISKIKIVFKKGSLLSPLFNKLKNKSNILILANLPYLSSSELKEPSIKKEPSLALYGGNNKGLNKIEALLKEINQAGLKDSCLLLEIGYKQAKAVAKMAKAFFAKPKLRLNKDLRGFDRIVAIKLP